MDGNCDYTTEELTVSIRNRTIAVLLRSPTKHRIKANPLLLLSFATDKNYSLYIQPFCQTAELFLEQGQRVLSFDLPNHGERVDKYGESIQGLRNAFIAGDDPFKMFLEDAKAVIDNCIRKGLAVPGRIVVCGVSRAGYLALRLLADDNRVAAGAVFAPVTDWRYLSEFSENIDSDEVKQLRLSSFAERLAGKPIYIAIGNHDERVSTPACYRCYRDIQKANKNSGHPAALIDFHCTDDMGHSCGNIWYRKGAEFILKWMKVI